MTLDPTDRPAPAVRSAPADRPAPADQPGPGGPGGPTERLELRDLRPDDRPAAVALLARGMRDNPVNVAAFGPDPERRERCLGRMFSVLLRVIRAQQPIGAWDGDTLVGVAGATTPGRCQPTGLERIRFVPGMIAYGPSTARRVTSWLGTWAAHDPDRPHVHLGPVAVEPSRQRQGIGGLLLSEHCARLDADDRAGYLETDKPGNVRFYERHGYRVIDEADVLGEPNWFMLRPSPSARS